MFNKKYSNYRNSINDLLFIYWLIGSDVGGGVDGDGNGNIFTIAFPIVFLLLFIILFVFVAFMIIAKKIIDLILFDKEKYLILMKKIWWPQMNNLLAVASSQTDNNLYSKKNSFYCCNDHNDGGNVEFICNNFNVDEFLGSDDANKQHKIPSDKHPILSDRLFEPQKCQYFHRKEIRRKKKITIVFTNF